MGPVQALMPGVLKVARNVKSCAREVGDGTKPALAWWFTVDSGESDDEVCFFSSLASAASPRRVDNLAGWRTGAKIKVPV